MDYKNQMLLEMEHKYNRTAGTLQRLFVNLSEDINSRNQRLLEMEHLYDQASANVKSVVEEKHLLHDAHIKGMLLYLDAQLTDITNLIKLLLSQTQAVSGCQIQFLYLHFE